MNKILHSFWKVEKDLKAGARYLTPAFLECYKNDPISSTRNITDNPTRKTIPIFRIAGGKRSVNGTRIRKIRIASERMRSKK